jgi:alkylhydroperoxidase family enzyme
MIRYLFLAIVTVAGLGLWLGATALQPDPQPPRFPALSNDEAWKQLRGDNPALPAWARMLVQPLPRTTGSMLLLNHLHRARNRLGPVVAGKLHWTAADTLGCAYGKRYAEADLRRAGLGDDDLKQLAGDPTKLPAADRLAIAFARKLTRAASTVTDDEVAELLKEFGPHKVVAMVHTLAWANIENRIVLALGVGVEPGGPLPPLDPLLDAQAQAKLTAPARPTWKEAQAAKAPPVDFAGLDWRKQTVAELEAALEQQKARKPRIDVPAPDGKSPAGKIVWTQVSMGYQPLLTKTWFDTMGTFQQEAKLDRVFANTFFWVITRSTDCFY